MEDINHCLQRGNRRNCGKEFPFYCERFSPVETEAQALEFIEATRKKFWDATA